MKKNHLWMRWGGGLGLAACLGTWLTSGAAETSEVSPRCEDRDPVEFTTKGGALSLAWDPKMVGDLAIEAELARVDPDTGRDTPIAAVTLGDFASGTRALSSGSTSVPRPEFPAIKPASSGPTLIVERVIATAHLVGGDADHPFTTQTRRYYRLEGGALRSISREQWNALADPVEVHVAPGGGSYRFQRGRVDHHASRPLALVKEPGADRAILGAKPVRDPLLDDLGPSLPIKRSATKE